MELTDEVKQSIDARDFDSLMRQWQNSPDGDQMFQGESGDYFNKRMIELRDKDPGC